MSLWSWESITSQGHSLILVKGHSDFKVKCLTFGLYTKVSVSGPQRPIVSNSLTFPWLSKFFLNFPGHPQNSLTFPWPGKSFIFQIFSLTVATLTVAYVTKMGSSLKGVFDVQLVVVALLFYVHGKHLRSCRDGQLTLSHFSWAGLDLLSG